MTTPCDPSELTAVDAMRGAVDLPDDTYVALAKALNHHGLLATYAPHHNPSESSPHTRPGPARDAWYRSHHFTDPETT